jgi:hypothetical protein
MGDAPDPAATGRTSSEKAKIFISYRRRETAGHAGRLYDDLVEHFGRERIFMDLTMEPGVDYAEQINEAVGSCGALIVLIGEEWLTVADATGQRRIEDPTDLHRLEVEAGLDRQVRLIPALVQDAKMPTVEQLPAALQPLVRRQAVELSDQRWDYDVGRLITTLERVLSAETSSGASRTVDRLRRKVHRNRGKAGLAVGVLGTLLVVGTLLAATGYFKPPRLEVTSFEYNPPKPGESIATCRVRVSSDYRVKSARFIVDGNEANSLMEETSPPWGCNNRGRENHWDTCEGHSAGFPLDDSRPHTLTVTITDAKDNTTSKTRSVTTSCPQRAG